MNWEQRRVYVSSLVDVSDVKQRKSDPENSRKSRTFTYHLFVDGERKCVCKTMFLHTLDIGQWSVSNWVLGGLETDRMHNKTRQPTRQPVLSQQRKVTREFLANLPKLHSHYCRQNTSKEFLEPEIGSMKKLHGMLRVYCDEHGKTVPSRSV